VELPELSETVGLGSYVVVMLGTFGERLDVRTTLPEKPRLLSVIVDEAPPSPHTTGAIWPALNVKSGLTVTETVAAWLIAPLAPFTVRV